MNLYPGLAEDAQKEGAEVLEPTTDSVTYSDGITEEVYGFDVRFLLWMRNLIWLCWEPREPGMTIR